MLAENDDDSEIDDALSKELVPDPILIPEIPFSNMPRRQLAKVRASVDHIEINNDFANHSEIALVRTLLKHST